MQTFKREGFEQIAARGIELFGVVELQHVVNCTSHKSTRHVTIYQAWVERVPGEVCAATRVLGDQLFAVQRIHVAALAETAKASSHSKLNHLLLTCCKVAN